MTEPILEVRDLRLEIATDRGTVSPVDGVSFAVLPGECLGLVGESGCGKSMTLRTVIGLLPHRGRVTGGSIRFDGKDLTASEAGRVRGHGVGMVFQEPMSALNPLMRIGDFVSEGIRVHRGLSKKAAAAAALQLLDEVGIPDAARRMRAWPHEFSGGMRQRVMIAAALASEPKVLLADEPTTALDVTVQDQILMLLDQLRFDRQLAIVFVSHDLAVVRQVAQRVQVMYAGRTIESGTSDEVLAHPLHPYTAGLLRALPTVDGPLRVLTSIPGSPPPPDAYPPGCRFGPRCEHHEPQCDAAPYREEPTGLVDRATACIRWETLFQEAAR